MKMQCQKSKSTLQREHARKGKDKGKEYVLHESFRPWLRANIEDQGVWSTALALADHVEDVLRVVDGCRDQAERPVLIAD